MGRPLCARTGVVFGFVFFGVLSFSFVCLCFERAKSKFTHTNEACLLVSEVYQQKWDSGGTQAFRTASVPSFCLYFWFRFVSFYFRFFSVFFRLFFCFWRQNQCLPTKKAFETCKRSLLIKIRSWPNPGTSAGLFAAAVAPFAFVFFRFPWFGMGQRWNLPIKSEAFTAWRARLTIYNKALEELSSMGRPILVWICFGRGFIFFRFPLFSFVLRDQIKVYP